jgi:hypothetical protein
MLSRKEAAAGERWFSAILAGKDELWRKVLVRVRRPGRDERSFRSTFRMTGFKDDRQRVLGKSLVFWLVALLDTVRKRTG